MPTRTCIAFLLLSPGLALCGCDGGAGARCVSDEECAAGRCLDGRCQAASDAAVARRDRGSEDAGGPGDAGTRGAVCDSGVVCVGTCCASNERCAFDRCVIDLGPCATNDDCSGDGYCDANGRCTPYGVPAEVENDPECQRPISIGDFTPDEQCRWDTPPEGDPLPSWNRVYGAPHVADFNLDDDPTVLAPSIVFATWDDRRNGAALRIIDGRTCEQQQVLSDAADRVIYATNLAIGDLDAAPDGRPEIVAAGTLGRLQGGSLIAFGYDAGTGRFVRRWYARRCDMDGEPRHVPNAWSHNNGPSMHDLNDDGVPEVLFDAFVYDAAGCLLNPAGSYSSYLDLGLFAVVADVDVDGTPELVRHDGLYEWTGADWALEPDWAPSDPSEATRVGHVAVADLGDFAGVAGDAPGRAEIVVASAPSASSPADATGSVRVMTAAGEIVFGPYALPAEPGQIAGRGGPPTIGDFDGDGRREFAVAGGSRYTVFDLDCDIDSGSAAGCARAAGLPRGVLWSRRSQDFSSNVTGSSVFDFDADGQAEVVYADECFVRIYRGTDGEVLFSSSASSGTGYELPVIADVDGDFNSEIVISLSSNAPSCPATDPIYTRGTATYEPGGTGVRVLRDVDDRWAASRPIWNQHAYSVTHVSDDGVIPRTSEWVPNHSDPTLNHFRMNAQGDLGRTGLADLTVALARASDLCTAEEGEITLAANVCNRGTNPAPDGARVTFYAGDPDGGAELACDTALPRLLDPGDCTEVSCMWMVPSGGARSVTVVVDPDGEVSECRDGNNRGVVPDIFCLL